MSAATLLDRLDHVRRTGDGRWIARCPAHDDRSPSLAVRELDDGRILVHDFGGCAVGDVLRAVGLELHELFPPRMTHRGRRERAPFDPGDVLRAIAAEAWIAGIVVGQVARGGAISEDASARGMRACRRLMDAAEAATPPSPTRHPHLVDEPADA